MKLYYIDKSDEFCWDIKFIKRKMQIEGYTELTVYEAKPERIEDVFFCREFGEWGDKGECGKSCDKYSPRNKKSGCCKHYSNISYEATDKTKIIKLKQK